MLLFPCKSFPSASKRKRERILRLQPLFQMEGGKEGRKEGRKEHCNLGAKSQSGSLSLCSSHPFLLPIIYNNHLAGAVNVVVAKRPTDQQPAVTRRDFLG